MIYPQNKDFIFTIFDDTDNATIESVKPVYDLLYKLGFKTTKSVWAIRIPESERYSGETLDDPYYLEFIKKLIKKGFEIAIHNVTSGDVRREEIKKGLKSFYNKIGYYPNIQVNHSLNNDNIYWGPKRFVFPMNVIYRLIYKKHYLGEEEDSPFFWGDLHKKYIKYTRNHTFNDINTLKRDPFMPYSDKKKIIYSNYWFSSTDASNIDRFIRITSPDNIDKLISERGISILYTHFSSGFVNNGKINEDFVKNMEYISSKNGLFVPVSNVLDNILEQRLMSNHNIRYLQKLKLDFYYIFDRILEKIKKK